MSVKCKGNMGNRPVAIRKNKDLQGIDKSGILMACFDPNYTILNQNHLKGKSLEAKW